MLNEVFTPDNWFLIFLGILWIVVAIIQDFRSREVANWWNFSLIIAVLSYRGFVSIYSLNYWPALWGVIGLCVGVGLGNLFYYARMFAGGDAKLMYGVGTILPLGLTWVTNLNLLIWFLGLFLIAGGGYGLIYSVVLCMVHKRRFSKEFSNQMIKNKIWILSITISSIILVFFGIIIGFNFLIWIAVLLFISPFLLVYAKSVEESCMFKKVGVSKLTIGDWLAKDIKVGKKWVKQNWEGLDEKELKILQKNYKGEVLIKQGIPFTPSFLIAYIILLIIFWFNLNTLTGLF